MSYCIKKHERSHKNTKTQVVHVSGQLWCQQRQLVISEIQQHMCFLVFSQSSSIESAFFNAMAMLQYRLKNCLHCGIILFSSQSALALLNLLIRRMNLGLGVGSVGEHTNIYIADSKVAHSLLHLHTTFPKSKFKLFHSGGNQSMISQHRK